jgi:phage-related minor tail protein
MDDRIDVGISVTSDQAEAGAKKAADAMGNAVAGIQQQLERLTATTQANSQVMANGFNNMASAVTGAMASIGSAVRANATIIDDYGNEVAGVSRKVQQANEAQDASNKKVAHSSTAARREMLVLAHELSMGNYKRFAGSLMVLGEQMDWMGKLMSPLGLSIGVIAGALAIAAHAAIDGAMQMSHLRDELILTGNYAGLTGGQFIEMGNDIASVSGAKISAVRDVLSQVAATGRFTGEALQPVATAIAKIGEFSKANSEEVVKSFEKMDEGVYKWAVNYNNQYHFANIAQLEHIRLLEEQGQKERAEAETANLVIAKIQETANQLGYMPGLWHDIRNAASDAWDAMMNWGRPLTIDDQIKQLKDKMNSTHFGEGDFMNNGEEDRRRLRQLQQTRDQKEGAAANQANSERVQVEGQRAVDELRAKWKGLGGDVHLADEEVEKFRTSIQKARDAAKDANVPVPKDVQYMIDNQAKLEENIRKKYDRNDTKKPKGQETVGNQYSNQNAQMQASLNLLKEKLKEEQADLDAAYKQNQVSLQHYYAERLRITLEGMDKERAVVAAQLQQTQQLQSQAKNPQERLSMMTKEIELQGRLQVMDQQRAATIQSSQRAVTEASNKELQAMQDLEAKRTQLQASEEQKRALMLAQQQAAHQQITGQQLLQLEAKFAQQETDQALQALQKRLDTERDLTLQQRQSIEDQKTALIQENETKQLQYQIAATDQAAQYQTAAANQIEGAFTKAFEQIASGTVNAKTIFLDFAQSVENAMTQMVAKQLTMELVNGGSGGAGGGSGMGGMLNSLLSMFGGGGGAGFDSAGAFGFSTAASGSTDAVIGGLGSAGAAEGGSEGMSALMGLASFDVGTPFVPKDQIAMIHRGEAIVPAHMNSPYNPGSVSVNNQFVLPNQVDMRTQSQIAAMSGGAIQNAIRRNG